MDRKCSTFGEEIDTWKFLFGVTGGK